MLFQSTYSREKDLIRWAQKFKIELPSKPEELVNVIKLDFSLKGIDKLPKEIDSLPNLEEIHGEFNKLVALPWEFAQLKKLKVVNFGHNKFIDIPGVICQLSQIEVLNVEGNSIKKINPVIANLVNLTDLNLSFNLISDLPTEFSHLKHLLKLNLAANKLNSLPDNFQKLYNLTEIRLWKNGFTEIPSCLKDLPNLTVIEMETDETNINQQLVTAVVNDDVSKVEKLLVIGADLNFKWHNYANLPFTTPLFEARSVEMVKFLLEKGADVSIKRELGKPGSIKVWEGDKKDYETFLTMKHNSEVLKYLRTVPNLK